MYGLVNAAVQEFVCTNFGQAKWAEIKAEAGVTIDEFGRMTQYPDETTYKLVGAASKILGVTPQDALRAFGEFWVLYTGKEGYGDLFDSAGGSLKDFLYNLDNMHTRVGASFQKLKPPSFRFDVVDDDTLRMHYQPGLSTRTGLCPMVEGLVTGLSRHFQTEVTLEHAACSANGADHCEWILTFPAGS
jgi:hypothetical protein